MTTRSPHQLDYIVSGHNQELTITESQLEDIEQRAYLNGYYCAESSRPIRSIALIISIFILGALFGYLIP